MTTTTVFTFDDLTTTNGGRTRADLNRQVTNKLVGRGMDGISLASLVTPIVSTLPIGPGE